MKIALINGSPKIKESASGALLEDLKGYLLEKAEIVEIALHTDSIPEETLEKIRGAEALVFSFPLYVDGIPAHLLSCLVQLEEMQMTQARVFGIVNCGFYEGIQADLALKVLENWCVKVGGIWGSGIGVGGGGALAMMPKMEEGKGPKAPIEAELRIMSDMILSQETKENSYVSVAFPRFLYKMAAQMGWRQSIKANGGKRKDLAKRPE